MITNSLAFGRAPGQSADHFDHQLQILRGYANTVGNEEGSQRVEESYRDVKVDTISPDLVPLAPFVPPELLICASDALREEEKALTVLIQATICSTCGIVAPEDVEIRTKITGAIEDGDDNEMLEISASSVLWERDSSFEISRVKTTEHLSSVAGPGNRTLRGNQRCSAECFKSGPELVFRMGIEWECLNNISFD
jgi:hypothetical protein